MQSPLHAAETHLFSVIIKHSEHLKYMLLDWMSSIAVLEISPKYLHWEAKRQSVYKRQMKAYQQVFEVPSWRLNQYFGHLCLCSLKQDMMSKVWMWWRKRGSCMIYDKHWHITHKLGPPWIISCSIVLSTPTGTIIYKMNITLYST